RDAGQACLQRGAAEILSSRLLYFSDDAGELRALHRIGIQGKHDQCEGIVAGNELVAKNLVRLYSLHQLLIGASLRQLAGNQRSGQLAGFGRFAGRKQRDDAARAVDQLQIGDEISQLFDRGALQQRLALNDDEDVELAGRKSPGLLLIQPEPWRIRTEKLAERIVDLDP